jgi:hypothetical protein
MKDDLLPEIIGRLDLRRLSTDNLKRCPLCGSINARENDECFVCAWYGDFSYDSQSIEEGLDELIEHCPELADLLVPEPTRMERFKSWTRRMWLRILYRPVDFRV